MRKNGGRYNSDTRTSGTARNVRRIGSTIQFIITYYHHRRVPVIHHNDSATFVAESAINFSSREHESARARYREAIARFARGWIRLGRRIRKSVPTYAVHPLAEPRLEEIALQKLSSFLHSADGAIVKRDKSEG